MSAPVSGSVRKSLEEVSKRQVSLTFPDRCPAGTALLQQRVPRQGTPRQMLDWSGCSSWGEGTRFSCLQTGGLGRPFWSRPTSSRPGLNEHCPLSFPSCPSPGVSELLRGRVQGKGVWFFTCPSPGWNQASWPRERSTIGAVGPKQGSRVTFSAAGDSSDVRGGAVHKRSGWHSDEAGRSHVNQGIPRLHTY